MPVTDINVKDIKNIFSRLQDDESRLIFQYRFMHCISGNSGYLAEMVKKANNNTSKWKTIHDIAGAPEFKNAGFILYGIGHYSKFALDMLLKHGIKPVAFCDRKTGIDSHLGLPVIVPDRLLEYKNKYLLISSMTYRDEIYETLMDMQFPEEQIFSVGTFDEQYFGCDFLRPVPNEIYVDVGCYDDFSIERFIKFTGGSYKKIFGLEPSRQHFMDTAERVRELKINNVELINKAAWSKETTIDFAHSGKASRVFPGGGDDTVSTTTIDTIVDGEDVTFIKIDIEGAEHNGLIGTMQTIYGVSREWPYASNIRRGIF